ncbi:MAG: arylsulfatase [Planctomycetota bacterium]|jgi:arylsulfatase
MVQFPSVFALCSIFVLPLFTSCNGDGAETGTKGPNVVLISVDSLRRDHLSTYGYKNALMPHVPTTPAIDRLAKGGLRFDDAVSTTSWTLPSHMAMMTGLPDTLHGVVNNEKRLDPALSTLAQLLRARGYQTGGFFTGPNLHPIFGFSQGFDTYESCSDVEMPLDSFQGTTNPERFDMHEASHKGLTSPALLERSLAWLDEAAAKEDPFFLFVHWWDPHYDYNPPDEYAEMFDPGYDGDSDATVFFQSRQMKTHRDMQHVLSMYDAEIRYTDDHIGMLLERIEQLGLAKDTLIVFTADHGDEFFDHGKKGHQRNFYDESVRLPLVMRLPGVLPTGQSVQRMARIQDIGPTILDLCDVAAPEYFEGVSLRSSWEPRDPSVKFVSPVQILSLDLPNKGTHKIGLRRKDLKIVWDFEEQSGELFVLYEDPDELNPLVFTDFDDPAHPAVRFFKQHIEAIEARRASLPKTPGHMGVDDLPEDLMKELAGFGYLDGDLGDEDDGEQE